MFHEPHPGSIGYTELLKKGNRWYWRQPDDYTNGHIVLMGDLHTVPGDHNVKGTVGLERNENYCEEEKKVDEDMVD